MESADVIHVSPTVIDHAQRPRNYGRPTRFDGHARVTGPCGDTMEVWVGVRNGIADRVSFTTDGCAPSLACGSMATCLSEGKSLEEAASVSQQDILAALGGLPDEVAHCALLAADTMTAACEDYARAAAQQRRHSRGCEGCEEAPHGTAPAVQATSNEDNERRKLHDRLSRIRRKIVVLSGKGGVGKSTVAVNLAVGMARLGKRVGLLDVDVHGPSIPTMLGLEQAKVTAHNGEMLPIDRNGLKVLSLGFFLGDSDDAVVWRGPMKTGVIGQFLKDAAWGELDFLVVDSPPGTGDEPLSVIQLLEHVDGAIVVTTPQRVSAIDVRRSVTFCRRLGVPVLGVVENMSGFVCPSCGDTTHILHGGAGAQISRDMQVPFLGSIPVDPRISETSDAGEAVIVQHPDSPAAAILRALAVRVGAMDENEFLPDSRQETEVTVMRIAIPVVDGTLSMHFGHCERFAIIDVDAESKAVLRHEETDAPPHQPGLLPRWLAERGVNTIIAGGMGQRAQGLFTQHGISVVIGAPCEAPDRIVADYLAGTLQTGENVCDH